MFYSRISVSKIIISLTFLIITCTIYNSAFAGNILSDEEIQKCKKESRIDEPSDKSDGLGYPLTVKGKAANCPSGYHLWVVVHPVLSSGYWPQSGEIFPSPRDNSWEVKVWLGEVKKGIGEDFQIILGLANDEAHKYFVKYLEDGPKQGFPEKPIPDGVIQIDRITYKRSR